VRACDGPLTADTLYLYPTALKAEAVLHDRAGAAGALLAHRVTTFPELTDALARELTPPARLLEPEMAAVVLAHALDAPGTPEPLRAPRRGLAHELLGVIGELKASYLAPDDVVAIAAALPSGPAARRLSDLARVYAAYEEGLARLGAVDRHGRDWRVCDALATAEASGSNVATLAGVRKVVFAEIYDFSVLQFLIATAIIRLVGDAELVAFAHPENVDATRFLERTWNRFVGDPAIADQVLPSFVAREGRSGSLAAALGGVFASERKTPVPADGSVRLVVAPSRYREVEAAVRDVRRRLERGERPERMAVLVRDLATYGDLVEDVCRRYRVPVHFRKGKPLVANGLVKACLNVLRCVAEGFPRARLEALLDTDYLAAAPRRLVRTLREVGFVAETARPLSACVAHRVGSVPATRRETLAAAGRELDALVALLRGLDGRRSVAAHVEAFRRALRRLRVRPVPRDDVAPRAARRDARAWERFERTLVELAGLGDALRLGTMPLDAFVRLLVAALEPLEVDDASTRAGSVRALSVLDARGLDFDTVYVLGLDDGTFPAPRGESPLWPDAMKRDTNPVAAERLRRKLGARAEGLPLGGLLRTAREASLEDPFLFFLALSMAEREVVLSYPAVNEQGNPTVPSPFLDEVRACTDLPAIELDATELVPAAEECCEPAELVNRAALARWSRDAGVPPDRLTAALREADPELARRLDAIDRRAVIEERRSRYFLSAAAEPRKAALADAFVGRLAADDALHARLDAMRWTPSRLETLGACGFKFFAREILGLAPLDDPAAAVDAAERGTLVHALLEALLLAHPRLPREVGAARALGREFVARMQDVTARSIRAKDPALLDVTWGQIAAAVDALVVAEHARQAEDAAEGVTVDHVLERMLGRVLADPAGDPPIALAGKPDRLDVRRHDGRIVGLRVLDYKMTRKSGDYAARIDPARELGKTAFQIPVYLLAALAELAPPSDVVLEGGYLPLLAGGRPPVRGFDAAELDGIAARIVTLVRGARAGRFDVDPDPCDPYCAYRPACRFQRPPLEEETGGGG
jgi:ATP-dependent helicase/nuclease subunit B